MFEYKRLTKLPKNHFLFEKVQKDAHMSCLDLYRERVFDHKSKSELNMMKEAIDDSALCDPTKRIHSDVND